jgi:hypothetical protein
MKIVKFKNGKYAIRKGIVSYEYKDLKTNYWWSRYSNYFSDCQGTLKEIDETIKRMKEKGNIISNVVMHKAPNKNPFLPFLVGFFVAVFVSLSFDIWQWQWWMGCLSLYAAISLYTEFEK